MSDSFYSTSSRSRGYRRQHHYTTPAGSRQHSVSTTPVGSRMPSRRSSRFGRHPTPATFYISSPNDTSWQDEVSWHFNPTNGYRDGNNVLGAALSPAPWSNTSTGNTPFEGSRIFRRSANDCFLSHRGNTNTAYSTAYNRPSTSRRLELKSYVARDNISSSSVQSYSNHGDDSSTKHSKYRDVQNRLIRIIRESGDAGNTPFASTDGHEYSMPARKQNYGEDHFEEKNMVVDKDTYRTAVSEQHRHYGDGHAAAWKQIGQNGADRNTDDVSSRDSRFDDDDEDEEDRRVISKPVGLLSLFKYSTKFDTYLVVWELSSTEDHFLGIDFYLGSLLTR